MIIEDVGEPENGVSKFFKSVPFRREEITFTNESNGEIERVGDYTNDEVEFLAERKSAFDYLNSVMDGRYLRQLHKMWKYFEGPKYLIFEGDWEALLKVAAQKGKNFYRHIVSSRLKAIAFNVNWIQTWDKSDTAKFILQLNEFAKNNKTITIKPHKMNLVMCRDERIRVLAVGIGQSRATKVLAVYNSLEKIAKVLKEDPNKLVKIEGIGPRTVDRLKDLFLSESEVVFIGRHKKNKQKGAYRNNPSANIKKSGGVRKTGKEYARAQYMYRTTKRDKRTGTSGSGNTHW